MPMMMGSVCHEPDGWLDHCCSGSPACCGDVRSIVGRAAAGMAGARSTYAVRGCKPTVPKMEHSMSLHFDYALTLLYKVVRAVPCEAVFEAVRRAQAHQALQQMHGQAVRRKRELELDAGAPAAALQPPAQRMRHAAGAPRCQPRPLAHLPPSACVAACSHLCQTRYLHRLALGWHS